MNLPDKCLCIALNRYRCSKDHSTNISIAPVEEGTSLCLVALKGIFKVHRPGRTFVIDKDTILHLPAAPKLTIQPAVVKASEIVELRFEGGIAHDFVTFFASKHENGIHLDRHPRLLLHLRRLKAALSKSKDINAKDSFRWFSLNHEAVQEKQSSLGDFIKSGGQDFLETALSQKFQLKALANRFGCSPSLLAENLRAAHGASARTLLQECRWYHASRLIKETDLPVREIAHQCGYSSAPAFNAAYKKRFGVQPGKSRKIPSNKRSKAVPPPRLPAPVQAQETTSPTQAEIVAAVVPHCPYFHFDGGIASYPYEKPYKLALNTLSEAIQWNCCLEGEAIFQVGNSQVPIKAGMVIIFPQPINAQWISPNQNTWKRVWIKVRGLYGIRQLEESVLSHGAVLSVPLDSPPVRHAIRWTKHWLTHRGTVSPEGSAAAFEWCIQWENLLKSGNFTPVPTPELSAFRSRSFFRKIKSVTDYAKQVGYSRSHLSQKLSSQWLDTPQPASIIRRHKLLQAAQELRETNLSISVIARKTLYAHDSSFIEAFKREFSQTPLQYRLNYLRQHQPAAKVSRRG